MVDPTILSNIEQLKKRAQALALLDAILSPDWEFRYFSFNNSWNDGEQLASMRNGLGDEWFLLFAAYGAALKGLAHEYPRIKSPEVVKVIQSALPESFQSFINEPAFSMDSTSFCYWNTGDGWQRVELLPDDGSDDLLQLLIHPADEYQRFASEYYELEVPLESIEAIYRGEELTEELATSINPEVDFEELQKDIESHLGTGKVTHGAV